MTKLTLDQNKINIQRFGRLIQVPYRTNQCRTNFLSNKTFVTSRKSPYIILRQKIVSSIKIFKLGSKIASINLALMRFAPSLYYMKWRKTHFYFPVDTFSSYSLSSFVGHNFRHLVRHCFVR